MITTNQNIIEQFINEKCNTCEEACHAIGGLLGYEANVINQDLEKNTPYDLLKQYLFFLRNKSTWIKAEKEINEQIIHDSEAVNPNEKKLENEINSLKFICLIRDTNSFKEFRQILEKKFNFGIEYHLQKIKSIEEYENIYIDINQDFLDNLTKILNDNNDNDVALAIGNLTSAITHLRALRSTPLPSRKNFIRKNELCNHNIKIYKEILNHVLGQASKKKTSPETKKILITTIDNAFKEHVYYKIKIAKDLCLQQYQNKLSETARNNINDYFKLPNTNDGSNDSVLHQLAAIDKLIENIKSIAKNSKKDDTYLNRIIKDLESIKKSVLTDFSIYLTHDKNNRSGFGCVHPGYYFKIKNKKDAINEIEGEIKANIDHLKTGLQNNLHTALKSNIEEINHKKNSIPSNKLNKFKEFIKTPIFGPQNNQPGSINSIKNTISFTLDSLRNINKELRPRINQPDQKLITEDEEKNNHSASNSSKNHNDIDLVTHINSIFLNYHTALYDGKLKHNKEAFKLFFNSLEKIKYFLNKNRHALLALSINHLEKDKLYSHIFLSTHQELYKKTHKNLTSLKMKFLKRDNYPECGVENLVNELRKIDFLWNTESLIHYLNKINNTVMTLRQHNYLYTKFQADALEKLGYDMVYYHVIKSNNSLPLTFTHLQLEKIKDTLRHYKCKDSIKSEYILEELDKKILSNHQQSENKFSLHTPKKINSSTNAYRAKNGDFIQNAKHFEDFVEHFITKITSNTIANFAIASGKIMTTLSPPAIGLVAGANAIDTVVPGIASPAGAVIKASNQLNMEITSDKANKNIGALDDWLSTIKKLAEGLLVLFKPQIANMINANEVQKFTEFCVTRIFSALESDQDSDWIKAFNKKFIDEVTEDKEKNKALKEQRMIRFCTAAIFSENTITFPYATRYHANINTMHDNDIFGKLTFEKLVEYSGFLILDNDKADVLMTENLVLKNKNNKLTKTRLQKYGFLDGSDDPEFYRWLANYLSRHPHSNPDEDENDSDPENEKIPLSGLVLKNSLFNQNNKVTNVQEFVNYKISELQTNRNSPNKHD